MLCFSYFTYVVWRYLLHPVHGHVEYLEITLDRLKEGDLHHGDVVVAEIQAHDHDHVAVHEGGGRGASPVADPQVLHLVVTEINLKRKRKTK